MQFSSIEPSESEGILRIPQSFSITDNKMV